VSNPLALHTWTLDTTPLADALAIARRTGWDAVELRRVDFVRAREAGKTDDDVLGWVRASGLAVACVGAELGWLHAEGAERARLLGVFAESCRAAAALACPRVMSAVGPGEGDLARSAASVREVAAIAQAHGVRLAFEFSYSAPQLNTLGRMRELVARAGHPACGLLLDTYHIQRSGGSVKDVEDVTPDEIVYVQFSDVPAGTLDPKNALNRLPAGKGVAPIRELFAAFAAKGYHGPFSYEAPNPVAWARPPEEVAREGLAAARAVLPSP
jgi:sugar phosphate isomerase/epimerase